MEVMAIYLWQWNTCIYFSTKNFQCGCLSAECSELELELAVVIGVPAASVAVAVAVAVAVVVAVAVLWKCIKCGSCLSRVKKGSNFV